MKTKCCGALFKGDNCPVYWNELNEVVLCHNCGEQFVPVFDTIKLTKERDEAIEILVNVAGDGDIDLVEEFLDKKRKPND